MRVNFLMVGTAAIALVNAGPLLAQQAPGDISPAPATAPARATSYDAKYFAQYAPRTALDIVQRLPGFSFDRGNSDLRGFSGAAGNIVIDGQRPSSKSESLQDVLARIPASRVVRVDVGPGDLYGADYSTKAQVANLILSKGGGGIAGNVSVSGNRLFTGIIVPNASGSVQLSRGPSTFSLSADTARYDQTEKGYDRITDATSGEILEYRRKTNFLYPRDPFLSGSWALEQGDNRSLHLNARFSPSRFSLRQVNHVIPAGGPERDDTLHQKYRTNIFEIGGDITRPLGGGAIKLVGLINGRDRTTFDDYLFRGLGGAPVLGGFEQNTKSKLTESIGKFSWSKPDVLGFSFETGGEVAYNKLDYALDLFELEAGGAKTRIDLPLEDATVSEIRGEFYVNAGRPLSKTLRVDAALNYELSRLQVRGDAIADRSLKFLKPSVTLDWQPGGGWHSQFILRRTVAQLNFYDFVSVAELSTDRINGGNANLVPQRTWAARVTAERPLLGTGKARFELGYDLIDQLQDRVLIIDSLGQAFDSPGNLGTGRRYFVDLTLDAPLDRIWKGLRAKVHGQLQRTRVKDPISGQVRNFSDYYPDWSWDVDLRRDAGKFAYGINISDRDRFFSFRTDEIASYPNLGPYASAFIEYRPNSRSSMTLNVENLLDTPGVNDRYLYFPNRTDPVPDVHEYRFRNSHTRLQLTYKLSFGGGGVAK
ncbi:MAG: outer membrane beta-barrel protein [Sphingomicrobium sp.]